MQASMKALDDTQSLAVETGDDLLDVLGEAIQQYSDLRKQWVPVSYLKGRLSNQLCMTEFIPRGLRDVVSSSFQLNKRLQSSEAYKTKLGMKIRERGGHFEYYFDPPAVLAPIPVAPVPIEPEYRQVDPLKAQMKVKRMLLKSKRRKP